MRLEQYTRFVDFLSFLDFNSIKVRLERKYDKNRKENLQFQFHKGAIRTRKVLGVDVLRIYGFVGAKIQKNLQKNVDA